ncbi:unnamed protein product [Eruca vesicaria subsp. sativa]|uniref:Uncharacterized protein n=1 Tax=Eruca vesicaria subsp. sativa TaxID=29727 RepID=A0ABC8M2S6_ERUVS|nr:unnamed protein product [Eruca vesicaria subsp. sativa]
MRELKHLKTSRAIHGLPLDIVGTYILISMLLVMDIFEKLTGTTTNPDSSLLIPFGYGVSGRVQWCSI